MDGRGRLREVWWSREVVMLLRVYEMVAIWDCRERIYWELVWEWEIEWRCEELMRVESMLMPARLLRPLSLLLLSLLLLLFPQPSLLSLSGMDS